MIACIKNNNHSNSIDNNGNDNTNDNHNQFQSLIATQKGKKETKDIDWN